MNKRRNTLAYIGGGEILTTRKKATTEGLGAREKGLGTVRIN